MRCPWCPWCLKARCREWPGRAVVPGAAVLAGTEHLLPSPPTPAPPQMFFRATLFSAFGASKRWLATNPDGTTRQLSSADFFKVLAWPLKCVCTHVCTHVPCKLATSCAAGWHG